MFTRLFSHINNSDSFDCLTKEKHSLNQTDDSSTDAKANESTNGNLTTVQMNKTKHT